MNYPYVDEENNLVYFNAGLIIVNDDVEMRWSGRNKKYYVELGYMFTKMTDSFYQFCEDFYPNALFIS